MLRDTRSSSTPYDLSTAPKAAAVPFLFNIYLADEYTFSRIALLISSNGFVIDTCATLRSCSSFGSTLDKGF